MAAESGRSLMVLVGGVPGETDVCTSLFRLVEATLEAGHRVSVWACGWATGLTHTGLGPARPRDVGEWDRVHPSTSALVTELVERHAPRLEWSVCRFCAQDHGLVDQVPAVRLTPSQHLPARMAAADVAITMTSV